MPEISKLIAAIAELVSALSEKAGVPDGLSRGESDIRYTPDKTRAQTVPGIIVSFAEPQETDKSWNKIAKIFAKVYTETIAKPDYEEETATAVPSAISQVAVTREKEKDKEGFFEEILNFLKPIVVVVGGIALAIAALFAGPGPLGNTLNIISKYVLNIGSNLLKELSERIAGIGDNLIKFITEVAEKGSTFLSKGVGRIATTLGGIATKVSGVLLKVAKRLPFVGSAVSFYFAFQRFQQGDYLGSALEIASGLVNLIPGFGWIGSALIDVITITRDLTTTQEERTGGMGMGIVKMLTRVALNIGGKLLKVLKFVPFIGSAVSFYFAYKRFQEGDYVGMALEIVSGIADLIPGVGNAISMVIDIISLSRDVATTKEQRAEQSGGLKKLFSGIGDFFKKHGMTILKGLPVAGSLIYFYEAYQAGFTTPEGIKKTITAFASVLGAGPLIDSAINLLFSLFDEKEEESETRAPAIKGKSFFQIVKEYIATKIKKLPFAIRKPLEWLGIVGAAGEEDRETLNKVSASTSGVINGEEKIKELEGSIVDRMSGAASTLDKISSLQKNIINSFTEAFSDNNISLLIGRVSEFEAGLTNLVNKGKAFEISLSDSISKIKEFETSLSESINTESKNVAEYLQNTSINIQSPALDSIASSALTQVNILKQISEKMNNLSLPGQKSAPATAGTSSGPAAYGGTGGTIPGITPSSFFPVNNYSPLA